MSNIRTERVIDVHHWTDRLFSFTTTRDPAFRFENGQFTMIGLEVNGKPLLRAYSVASPNYEDTLEFLSIKVQNGPLTSRLQHIKRGDPMLVGAKPVGTLVKDNLKPGRTLYMLSTGTGLAPFMSLIRDPDVYDRFETVVLTHTCREVAELAYYDHITKEMPDHEFYGEAVRNQLIYYPTVTREPFRNQGRITDLIDSGKLFTDIGTTPFDPAHDRIMICGSPEMLADLQKMAEARGFKEGNSSTPGEYVIEKAFVDR
ncbi:ferredoxin--NADP reductase [Tistrella bauzanensis]|jgi:ferredoxin--NADP+ reductase|uniref:ferredoxin--NADP(+) reductase n=2 Tax=Tistrella TaxID=171436 RepID=A0ABU9YJ78_9PROT|nr:ferredoxin--NADP reductase [Tistrella bauzanensis]GGB57471.1 ferredoxin--NADP(+) reductase [Tistrella bauzanensis]